MNHTILLFGSSGLLGWYIKNYLNIHYNVICVTRFEYDILKSSTDKLIELINIHKPSIIINCSNCYKGSFEEQVRINSYFPILLDKLTHKYKLKYIHFSTNGVFLNSLNSYEEDDIPNAIDNYGLSKMIGENIKGTVIRTTIIGESVINKYCFIEWLKLNRNNKIKGYINDYWNGVTCLTIAESIYNMIKTNQFKSGICHIVSNDIISKYELCKLINQIYKLNLIIESDNNTHRNIILKINNSYLVNEESLKHQIYKQKIFTRIYTKQIGSYTNKNTCRFCDSNTHDIFHLGDRFGLAGGFLNINELNNEKVYPLTLSLCSNCKYIQCKQLVSSDELFKKHYYYYSSMIFSLVTHFSKFAKIIHERYPNKDIKIIEIGCNDGVLLHPLKNLGYTNLIGIDPSRTIFNIDNTIETYNEYFNDYITDMILTKHGPLDIFISCNSFAHIDDMKTIMKNIKRILKIDGVALIEVHYSKHIFEDKNFDFIYHEHMGYYTVTSMYNICKLFDMYLINVENISTHGGSLRFTIHMKPTEPYACVQKFIQEEAYLFEPKYLASYNTIMYKWKEDFTKLIIDLQLNGEVFGYGASGRANTLMNFCNIHLDGIIDDADSKIGSYTPTFNVLIQDSKILYTNKSPKYIVILAWPYANSIIEKHKQYLKNGGTFIIPLPTIQQISI